MTNFSIPFSLTVTGKVSTVNDPNQIASDRMESLIGTYPGERVMLPDYGVNIPAYLFSSDFAQEQDVLNLQIQQTAAQWEPTLYINSVNVTSVEQEPGITRLDVKYSLSNNTQLTPAKTAVLLIGGTVNG